LSLQPGCKSSASLICLGIVTCPLMVKVVAMATLFLLNLKSNTLLPSQLKVNATQAIAGV